MDQAEVLCLQGVGFNGLSRGLPFCLGGRGISVPMMRKRVAFPKRAVDFTDCPSWWPAIHAALDLFYWPAHREAFYTK